MIDFLSRHEGFRKLLITNASVLEFNGPMGLRYSDVYCLSRDGREIRFAKVKDVPKLLERCLDKFENALEDAQGIADLSRAAARFWMTFIAIHPFADGNGRTAKVFLKARMAEKGADIFTFELIDKYLIEGDTEKDIENLTYLFVMSMREPTAPYGSLG